jgi:hypothetical protein
VRELVEYLLSIRPPNASGPIPANPETGRPYVDIRKQWNRLLAIVAEMIGYELTGKKAKFLNSATPARPTSRSADVNRATCSPSSR